MTWPKFWELTGEAGEMVQESEDTSMVTIYNIDVVTNYLQKDEYLMPDGEVRSVILSEMGFTSTYGEDVQAAAFAYAYYIAENNQHIDSMLLSRETDDAGEVAQGLALGLSYQNGRRKYIYDTFKYIEDVYKRQALFRDGKAGHFQGRGAENFLQASVFRFILAVQDQGLHNTSHHVFFHASVRL